MNNEIEDLAEEYLEQVVLSARSLVDCLHIATATIFNMDILISWNFKHTVNVRRIPLFNSVNLKLVYGQLQICSPKEVVFGLKDNG